MDFAIFSVKMYISFCEIFFLFSLNKISNISSGVSCKKATKISLYNITHKNIIEKEKYIKNDQTKY